MNDQPIDYEEISVLLFEAHRLTGGMTLRLQFAVIANLLSFIAEHYRKDEDPKSELYDQAGVWEARLETRARRYLIAALRTSQVPGPYYDVALSNMLRLFIEESGSYGILLTEVPYDHIYEDYDDPDLGSPA